MTRLPPSFFAFKILPPEAPEPATSTAPKAGNRP